MEVVIHGTKQGHKSNLNPNIDASFALEDVQNGAHNENTWGNSFYALAFINGGCVFSKYTIVCDTLRSSTTGYIAFSVFLHSSNELIGGGLNLKVLLDDLSSAYFEKYVRYNKINRGESILIHEEWRFVRDILTKYQQKEKDFQDEELESGSMKPAFYYYKSDDDLVKHFDNPYQEEYSEYKQIFFIDINLQGAGNPLYVLKNSGVEVTPDLENKSYYLNNYIDSKGVEIKANGELRSGAKGKNKIRAKWLIEIKFSKDDKCYEPIIDRGTILELSRYLEIRGDQILIKYDAFSDSIKKEKFVVFEIVDRKSNIIDHAEIMCKNDNNPTKSTSNNQIVFKGEEIKESWVVSVKNGDSIGKRTIVPADINDKIKIRAEERKLIPIHVKDEADKSITDFEVWTKLTNGYQRTNTIEFVDEDIIDSYDVTIRKNDYEEYKILAFKPHQHEEINVTLKKKPIKPRIADSPPNSNKKWILISGSGIVFLLSFWAIYLVLLKEDPTAKDERMKKVILKYVQGDSLMSNQLNIYRKDWEGHEQDFNLKPGSNIFGAGNNDSTKWESDWKPIKDSIELAMKKRRLINEMDFNTLKKDKYTTNQKSFHFAINKIDSTEYEEVKRQLGDVSILTLSEIADSLNVILKNIEKLKNTNGEEKEKQEIQNIKSETTLTKQQNPPPSNEKNKNEKINNTKDDEAKKEFENDFWSIVHKDDPSKEEFDNWFKSGGSTITYKNEFKKFYDNYLKTNEKFSNFINVPLQNRKRTKNLEDLKKLINETTKN